MVPSTMSPSLKYLIVSSIAARNASSDPMSLTATLGVVELACVLLVMCRLAPDADRESCGIRRTLCIPKTMTRGPTGTSTGRPRHARRPSARSGTQVGARGGRQQDTAQRSAYESRPTRSIESGHNRVSVGRVVPVAAGSDGDVQRD